MAIYCILMQVEGITKTQSGDPLGVGLSTAFGANEPLEPVPELEADIRDQKLGKVSLYCELRGRPVYNDPSSAA